MENCRVSPGKLSAGGMAWRLLLKGSFMLFMIILISQLSGCATPRIENAGPEIVSQSELMEFIED